MTKTHLTDIVMANIGYNTTIHSGKITAFDILKFAAAIDDTNLLFTDVAVARAAGYANIIAPPLFNAAVLRPIPFRSGLLEDGQMDHLAPIGLSHLQTMLAGQRWEILRPSIVGEVIQEVSSTKSIVERHGSTGPIVFVEKESVISTQDGEIIERNGATLILREPPPPLPPLRNTTMSTSPNDLPMTEWDSEIMIKRPDMITLFMSAAAIWAVHRIHWDTPYAQKEGLRAPILPGWMLSSYLAQLLQTKAPPERRLGNIDLRYCSPAHPGDTLRCAALRNEEGTLTLTMTNQNESVIVKGKASFVPV